MELLEFTRCFKKLASFLGYEPGGAELISKAGDYHAFIGGIDERVLWKVFGTLKSEFEKTEDLQFPTIKDFKFVIDRMKKEGRTDLTDDRVYKSKSLSTGKEAKWFNQCFEIVMAFHSKRLKFGRDQLERITPWNPSPILSTICKESKPFLNAAMDNKPDALSKYYEEWFSILAEDYKKQTKKDYMASGYDIVSIL